MVAAYSGQGTTVDFLLKSGADACLQDKRGNTAIMAAIIKAEFAIAKNLYDHPCDSEMVNNSGLTLEQFSEMFGQGEFIQNLKSS